MPEIKNLKEGKTIFLNKPYCMGLKPKYSNAYMFFYLYLFTLSLWGTMSCIYLLQVDSYLADACLRLISLFCLKHFGAGLKQR